MKGSLRGYAKHRKESGLPGGSLAACQKARDSGRIQVDGDGLVDFQQADRDWEAKSNRKQQRAARPPAAPDESSRESEVAPPVETDKGSFAEAQRQHEWEKVRKERLARRVREGELVEIAAVEAERAETAVKTRDAVMGLASRVVNRLPAEWRREVYAAVDDEARRMLAALSDDVRSDPKAA